MTCVGKTPGVEKKRQGGPMKKLSWQSIFFVSPLLVILLSPHGRADVKLGDVVTRDNIAQADVLLTPATRWMVERGMRMAIIEKKKISWPRAYREATDKYAAQVKLSADGGQLVDYVAGCPFPQIDLQDPMAGVKILWNYQQNPFSIDNMGTEMLIELIDSDGRVARKYEALWRRMMWIGRLYIDPKPVAPHNPQLHYSELWGPLTQPMDKAGLATLFYRYAAPDRPDDTYVYIPITRRVQRTTNGGRGDVTWGTDIDTDSLWGFNAKVNYWQFRMLAEKEILAVVQSGKYGDRSAWCAPRDGRHGLVAAFPCVQWEKRKVWVVEGVPAPTILGQYPYSKRILYLDQEFFAPLVEEMYDHKGELWRYFLPCFFYYPKQYVHYPPIPPTGGKDIVVDEWAYMPNGLWGDVQHSRATTFESPPGTKPFDQWQAAWYFSEDVTHNTADTYTYQFLRRGAR